MSGVNLKRVIIIGILMLVVLLCSPLSYAADKVQNVQEGKQSPISLAAKYGNSIYLNRVESKKYLFNGEKRITIPVKYYYRVKDNLFFLGEDNSLYYTGKEAAEIKELVKDIKTVVSTDENGDYIYALTFNGELYRITAANLDTKIIKKNVNTLYSAWGNWVVYQSLTKSWFKMFTNGTIEQIEHKGSEDSPFIPDTQKEGEASSVKHINVGTWCINEEKHHDLYTRHGGENQYYDYITYSWEYRDGSSGKHQFYSVFDGWQSDNKKSSSLKILGSDENNLYVSLTENLWDDSRSEEETYIKVFQIKQTDKDNSESETYTSDGFYMSAPCVINYNKCIYSQKLEDSEKAPEFYWISDGILILSSDRKNVDSLFFYSNEIKNILCTNNVITNVRELPDNLYFEEDMKSGETVWKVDTRNLKVSRVDKLDNNTGNITDNWKWQLLNVTRNTLYTKDSMSNSYKQAEFFEGDGIWLYSKGKVNLVYRSGSKIMLRRDSKLTNINVNIGNIDWDKCFSLDGWIYLYSDGYYSRFQPDNASVVQTMSVKLNSPVFESQDVVGFYNKSIGIYTWKENSYKTIAKLEYLESYYSKLINTKNAYIYYNSKMDRIESISKSGKALKVISGKSRVLKDLLYDFGYIYFIDENSLNLYRVLPDGSKLQKITGECISVTGFQDKLVCTLRNGVYSFSSAGKNKHLMIANKLIANGSYVDSVVQAGKRLVVVFEKSVADPDSDFEFLLETEIHSMTADYKSDIMLPSAEKYNIIDSDLYYAGINGEVWRSSIDGKEKDPIF